MEGPIPWARLEARIAPTHPKGDGKGRQPHPLPVMLRVHCVQPFCNPVMEDLLHEAESVRHLSGVSPEKMPDETTVPTSTAGWSACRSGDRGSPGRAGGLLKKGSIVDTTIISAPSSTENESNARDQEIHRTKKGNRWHFGMKLHVGTDPRGLVHHPEGTVASVHDLTPSDQLPHGEEKQIRADAGYRGIGNRRSTRIARYRGALP